ncbi:BTB/POZ and MATH domain-containing protein 1-like [Triticum aestivum]|nr:BTB/POZ and MATH domain-containing protein 1-like [Triticum aestivum]
MSSSIKPMSALVSALRSAGRQHLTASTVAAGEPITGSHVFRIHGYKQVRKTVPNGSAVESPAFDVGGHRWKVQCYPNGDRKEADGSTSIFLTSLGNATAEFKLSVLDHDGEPSVNGAVQQERYSANGYWGWTKFLDKENPNHTKHLEDDCLTVLCDVTVDPGLRAQAEVAAAPPFDLRGQLAEALWNKHPADVMVHVGGETFAAHRWVLEARSPVFKADLEGNATGELRVDDMDAEVFKTLLQFMYTDSAPQLDTMADNQLPHMMNEQPDQAEATKAERLLVAADRHGLEDLKRACEKALRPRVDMGSVAAMLSLAERHGCAVVKEACMEFLSCPGNLKSFIATDGFEQLRTSCPSAALELVIKQLP